jgi:tetratricopeptide (TPR) repeat protein/ferredoxin
MLIVAHVLHWWCTGRSVGRFVLSDTMRTLELGEINPGVLLFAAALLSTALLGRFMCGWFCHVGALQDLSAWLLRKARIRPHLFRSRLLGYVPLALALYMFVWPTIKREIAAPLLETVWPGISAALGVTPFPGWSVHLTTTNLWEGLPGLAVAIPFLIICGFATVYFLGARGLCRYACPYGGFLLPAEQLAIGRIVVDPRRCDQCGLCTATCTAGVRVHDQVREHGSVLDRNCIRSFDCVRSCPRGALSFSIATPAAFAGGPARRDSDLTLREELLCLAVFAGSFVVLRGLYDAIPLLMAAPLAVIAAYLTWKLIRLFRDPHVRLGGLQLRLHGRISNAGRLFLGAMVMVAVLLVHSAAVRVLTSAAARIDNRVQVTYDDALAGRASHDIRRDARAALSLYRLASSIGEGGIGLLRSPEISMRIAWLHLVLGDPDAAERVLLGLLASPRRNDALAVETARLLITRDRHDDAVALLTRLLADNPAWPHSRDLLADLLLRRGEASAAESLYREALARRPADPRARAGLGRVMLQTGRTGDALHQLRLAADRSDDPAIQRDWAIALFVSGRVNAAVEGLEAAARKRPAAQAELLGLAAAMLDQTGRHSEASSLRTRAGPAR